MQLEYLQEYNNIYVIYLNIYATRGQGTTVKFRGAETLGDRGQSSMVFLVQYLVDPVGLEWIHAWYHPIFSLT